MERARAVDAAWWVWSAIVAAAILGLSLGSSPDVPGFHFFAADKVGHLLAYGILAGSLLLAAVWRPGRGRGLVEKPWPVLVGVVVFGGLIELLQARAGRNADAVDLIADALGVIAAAGLWLLLRRRRARSQVSAEQDPRPGRRKLPSARRAGV